jgi:hypothetical protein
MILLNHELNQSIRKDEYRIGSETRYYVLTANLLNEPYKIFVVDGDNFVREIAANSLSEAKKLGMNLLLEYDVNYKLSDVTCAILKKERMGKRWRSFSRKI